MILFVSSDNIPHVGGKSTHILDLIDGLESNGINCNLYSQKQYGEKKLRFLRYVLAPLYFLNRDLYIYLYFEIWAKILAKQILRITRNNKVEAISVQDAFAAYALSKVSNDIKCPITLTMHTYFGIENSLDKEKSNFLTDKIYNLRLKHELVSLNTVDKIVAVDTRIKNSIIHTINETHNSKISGECCISIQNFTNTKKFCPVRSIEEKNRLRKIYGISEKSFVIICARRLVEKNGVEFAVEAMSIVENEDALLLIAGSGPQHSKIKSIIEKNQLEKKVIMLDSVPQDELISVYNMSDCAVVPSVTVNGLQEATSISALESMSCGLPTISSAIGGLKEMTEDGVNGVLVNERSSSEIARAIDLLANDKKLYYKISTESRRFVETKHSHLTAALKYYEVFLD